MVDLDDPSLNVQLMQADSVYWALKSKIKLLGGLPFTVDGYNYQMDIMRSDARHKVVMKCAQSGITTLFMLDAIHGLIYREYPQGVIYYFPTEKAVEGFSKTRFGPLVDDNPAIKRHLRNTNSVSIKKVGKTFLSLLGAKATVSIGAGKQDGTAVRSTPADYIIRDERDLFNESMVRMSKDRLQNSKIAKEVDLGTPTIPDFGIAREFNESTQNHWMIKCPSCNSYNCLVVEFPNCVKYDKSGYPYFCCVKCGAKLDPGSGSWVAKHPDTGEKEGWLVSHFITPNIDLLRVMDRYKHDQKEGKIGEFYNGILGLPYIAAEDRLTKADVFACCGNDGMRTEASINETALGADIGKRYHTVVVGEPIDTERARIIYTCRVKGFDAIHDIAKKYNVKSAVIDCRPYEEAFEKFRDSQSYRVYGAEYKDKQKVFCKTDDKAGIYSLLRTQMFDKTHHWIKNQQLVLPRRCDEIDVFAEQVCNCAKVLEEDEETGDRTYRYQKLGDEHYRSALNYFYMALQSMNHYRPQFTNAKMEKGKGYDPLTWGLN